MRFDPEFQNDQTASLKSMPAVKKDTITFLGVEFIITPSANGYLAATTKLPGKVGRGGTKSMAIGDLILRNQDDPE